MKVQIKKNLLLAALEKTHNVATRALTPDFNFSGKVTIEATHKKVTFRSSNGCMDMCAVIGVTDDSDIAQSDVGKFTTDAIRLRNTVNRLITDEPDSPIELHDDGKVITVRDVDAKRKKLAKLPREDADHMFSLQRSSDHACFFETQHFLQTTRTVADFESKMQYKIEYQVVLFHWIKNDLRVVCGDGTIFAVYTVPRHHKDPNKKELKRTIPVDQLMLIASLVLDSKELEVSWKEKGNLWMKTDTGLELTLKGMPDVDYVEYNTNAFRFDEAKAYADVKIKDLTEVANFMAVLRDKEREEQGDIHECLLTVPSSPGCMKFEMTEKQSKFQCEYEVPATFYDLGQSKFAARYAHIFFDNIVHANRHPYVRFYFIPSSPVANAKDADLGELDSNNIPRIKEEPDKCSLTYFFAKVKDRVVVEEDDD